MANGIRLTYRRLEYTRDRLLEFKKELLDTTKQAGGHDDGGFGGFGGFGGGGEVGYSIVIEPRDWWR